MNRTPEDKKAIVELWYIKKDHMTKASFADMWNICVQTLNRWIRQHERGELDK